MSVNVAYETLPTYMYTAAERVSGLVAVLRDSVGTSHMYIVAVLRDRCVLVERSVLTVINEDIIYKFK